MVEPSNCSASSPIPFLVIHYLDFSFNLFYHLRDKLGQKKKKPFIFTSLDFLFLAKKKTALGGILKLIKTLVKDNSKRNIYIYNYHFHYSYLILNFKFIFLIINILNDN